MSAITRAASPAVSACVALVLLAPSAGHADDPAAGKAKASQVCASCHGLNGIATLPEAPNLAGQSPFYLQAQLKAFRSGERKQEQMSIIAQDLSDKDIENVSAWYSSIKVTAKMPPAAQ
jgi:cytochrome c553